MIEQREPQFDPVIVSAARTAVGKAKRGSLTTARPETLMALVIKDLLKRAGGLDPNEIDDLIVGCAFPEGEQGMNIARLIGFRAGLPVAVPAETINRFCSSGVQSIAHAAQAISAGYIDAAIAGGVKAVQPCPVAQIHRSSCSTFGVLGRRENGSFSLRPKTPKRYAGSIIASIVAACNGVWPAGWGAPGGLFQFRRQLAARDENGPGTGP